MPRQQYNPIGYFIMVALLSPLFTIISFAQTSDYDYEWYTVDDGLSHNSVLDITKDKNGFIWTANFFGVSRFDGQRFYNYLRGTKGFSVSMGQKRILSYSDGRLIVPDSPGYSYINQTDQFIELEYAIPGMHKHEFYLITSSGDEWFSTDSAVFLVEHAENQSRLSLIAQLTEAQGEVLQLFEMNERRILVQTDKGLFVADKHYNTQIFRCVLNTGTQINIPRRILDIDLFWDSFWMVVNHRVFSGKLSMVELNEIDSLAILHGSWLSLKDPDSGNHLEEKVFSLENNQLGHLFIRTGKRILKYDPDKKVFSDIFGFKDPSIDLGEGNSYLAMFYDTSGILWVGTDRGLLKIIVPTKGFHTIRPDPGENPGPKFPKLNGVLIDEDHNLWIGTQGEGLYHGKPDKDGNYVSFRHYLQNLNDSFLSENSNIHLVFEDRNGEVYVCSKGLLKIIKVKDDVKFQKTEALSWGSDIFQINDRHLLVHRVTDESYIYDPVQDRSYIFLLNNRLNRYVHGHSAPGQNGYFYMSTNSGLFRTSSGLIFDSITVNNGILTDLKPDVEDLVLHLAYPRKSEKVLPDSLFSSFGRFIVFESEDTADIWSVSFNDGLLKRFIIKKCDSDESAFGIRDSLISVEIMHEGNKLSHGQIFELTDDVHHRIWCSTQNGLTCINRYSGECTRFFTEDGLPTNKFYYGKYKHSDGSIWLCTSNGLVWFFPDSIRTDPPPSVFINEFRLFNEIIGHGPDSPLSEHIMSTDLIRLPHYQNNLSFGFSALDYTGTNRIRYRYMMEGIDKDWIDAGGRRLADYSNMGPGKYTFRIIASNSNGVWNTEGDFVNVIITPPVWKRIWFILLISMLLISTITLLIHMRITGLKRKSVRLQELVNEKTHQVIAQREETDKMKSRFYTNISHEFRTPLTLILGPIEENLRKQGNEVSFERKVVEIIRNNARRLQRLINQLLDISKLEAGRMVPKYIPGDLSKFVNNIACSFYSLAESSLISYQIEISEQVEKCYFDPDITEKILINLISNAFKYSEKNGNVSIKLEYTNGDKGTYQHAIIEIADSGCGIPKSQISRIFCRFYEAPDNQQKSDDSMGIGLSLVRELSDLIDAKIAVESNVGQGSVFTICLPIHQREVVLGSDNVPSARNEPLKIVQEYSAHTEGLSALKKREKKVDHKETILIIEDNPDLRYFISEKLKSGFKMEEAGDGKQGLCMAKELQPELIISDLMMPKLNGIELCRQLKTAPETSHIPIIILTAKADRLSKICGLENGADDYLIKPFDAEELLVRAQNLIRQRKELRKIFKKEFSTQTGLNLPETYEDAFLNQFLEKLKTRIPDPEYKIDEMLIDMNMSRSQLFRKVKTLTGFSPLELLRNLRLKQAALLLSEGERNITSIMYNVGFNNHSWFTKCFRKMYGVNPSEYSRMTE